MNTQIQPQPITFANPVNARRVHIGIGTAQITLVKVSETPYAPLAPVLDDEPIVPPCDDLPTTRELDELYLRCAGWVSFCIPAIGILWEDPLTGGAFDFESAVRKQDEREEMIP